MGNVGGGGGGGGVGDISYRVVNSISLMLPNSYLAVLVSTAPS